MEELCSLYVLGEISAAERRELDKHLEECQDCRVSLHDFEQIVLLDLPAIAGESTRGQSSPESCLHNPEHIFDKMLKQVDGTSEATTAGHEPSASHHRQLQRIPRLLIPTPPAIWAASCAALVIAGVAIHVQRSRPSSKPEHNPMLAQIQAGATAWKLRAESAEMRERLSAAELNRSNEKNAAITASLASLRISYDAIAEKQKELERELAVETASLQQQESELATSRASLDQERQHVGTLTADLHDVNSEALEARAKLASFSRIADAGPPPVSSSPPEPRVTDADAREVFGARDLHIVDVYDVDRAGKTRRTYGRVYYVNRNLLLFYAFDLQDKRNNRKAVGFQAWGFRQPNSSKPEDLGLFYVDDASLNRWVLRVSDPSILARIDTVFVTLEPPQGSSFPRGPKLLFASLGGPPNHP